jgi:hypothetical protein
MHWTSVYGGVSFWQHRSLAASEEHDPGMSVLPTTRVRRTAAGLKYQATDPMV